MVIQVKNWKTAKDKRYKVSSTTKLSTSSIGLERVPRHMYLSFYMGLGGCYGYCEFPPDLPVEIDETEFQDINTKLKDYLTRPDCPQLYEQQLASLRKSDLSAQELEIIRRNRQVSFSALGFSSQVYPCLREFDEEIPTRSCTTAAPSTQFPKKQ
ncbi:hypothetical protein K7432_009496 [Basidiobolus ranarum]|uniref:Uncharacterized protein n=1 Tax=Basidiobolus ranarum TaxID=34480 RepID=A0ABR2WQ49_9FUNG